MGFIEREGRYESVEDWKTGNGFETLFNFYMASRVKRYALSL